ncbi:SDR family oxidoreductase [Roseomonas sp. OT10]|uniref:SDR family NAD(P)-dependent oxidoreductase n=1 Tax=Roseomonas cutis TaxID=2897332 RepID=UPI001E2F57E1|nr:SDR family NAD(P)-dependent oxidoreductase [Roseomonas sp. OT10]UFN48499.1 SDR family oxidoreductase [Roseomonas sp. OT10]
MNQRFADRVGVITGGAKGIGRQTVLRFLREGGTAAVMDLEAPDSEWVESLRREAGDAAGRLLYQSLDMTVETSVRSAFARVRAEVGDPTILVNNLGFGANPKPLEEYSLEEFNRFIAVNLTTAFLASREVLPGMRRIGDGRIVNLSSITGRSVTLISNIPYTTAKAALMGLTRKTAQEEGPNGIRVNAVAPGTTFTERVKARYDALGEEERSRRVQAYPLRRAARPEEIAAAILFLASDDASYITGVVLDVNGGQLMA